MAKNEIRLQYTGYVIFAAKLISVATGLYFQFMLGRAIPSDSPEYGIWGNINSFLPIFTIVAGVVPFWVMRCVARGQEGSAKTGLAINLVFSVISTAIYLTIIPIILPSLLSGAGVSNPAVYLPFYLIVSVEIVELYVMGNFEPCLQACSPQSVGYGLIVQQVVRTALGYVIMIQLGQPLLGAIVSTIIAFGVQLIYYSKLLSNQLKQRIQWGYVKEWLKGSILNIYSAAGGAIASSVFFMLFILGGASGMEIYYAALQIANVITYASFLSFALYPKLLAEKRGEDVTASIKTVLMFALPMTVEAIALSPSFIVLFRKDLLKNFPGVQWVLVVLALDSLVTVVSGLYGSVLFGVETVDREKMSLRSMVKSKLFKFYSLSFLHSSITIPTTFFVLTTFAFQQPLLAALSVIVINSTVRFAMFLILIVMVRRAFKVVVPWRSIGKYAVASLVMGAILFLLPASTSVLITLVWTASGGLIYLAVLMLIDKESRTLPRDILREFKKKKAPAMAQQS